MMVPVGEVEFCLNIYFKKQNIFYSLDMLISSNKKYGSVCWKMGPELRLMLLFAGK